MLHHQHDNWMFSANDPRHERDRMHLVALREARAATERRYGVAEQTALAGLMRAARQRLARPAVSAATGGQTVDFGACCA